MEQSNNIDTNSNSNNNNNKNEENEDILLKMKSMVAYETNLLEFKNEELYKHLLKYYGLEQITEIQKAHTTTQSLTCVRVNTLKTNRFQLVDKLLNHFNQTNQSYKLTNDDIITFEQLLLNNNTNGNEGSTLNNSSKNQQIINKLNEEVILIKNRGPFKQKPIYKQVVVGATCGESVLRGSQIFAPGVIGSAKYISKGEKVSVFVDLLGEGKKGFIVDQFYKEKTVFIGNGVSLMDRVDYYSGNGGVAIEMTERIYECPPLNSLFSDLIFVQHLPSILTVFQLEVEPGMRVLDMCSAPGGKTTLIASLMSDSGTVIAIDKNKKKQQMVQQACKDLGIKSVVCLYRDSAKLTKEPRDSTIDFSDQSFDRILLDGPCSGLGTRPRFIESSSLIDLNNSVEIQRRLIDNAVPLLKCGGILVYSTCTINPEENEQNVAYLLEKHGNMKLVEQFPHFGKTGLSNCGLTEEQQNLVQRFDPSDKLSSIGFFIAKFIKIN